ncbi:BING4CT-domain-containing protein [Metschnikowia bicuspidata]|uniref:U three protein 7 n=1 Tax=Metschnikowia bicuspidata TaxID=27322 RepID=A0A4P9ZJ49_9ASCO|nr:BING4CT-domain-containing protein [Metschnikowia bicuspidata]
MKPIKSSDVSKYARDAGKFPKKLSRAKSHRLQKGLKKVDQDYHDFVREAEATDVLLQEEAGFLEADGPMERTSKFRQDVIVEAVDVGTANKKVDLKLTELGPYTLEFTRNGRKLLIGGKKGHVASMDWRLGKLGCELFLNETVHAVKYLHNDNYFAVAQKKYTFIYDGNGVELHRLKKHVELTLLDFLPYHFLLVSAGYSGVLRYHDTSTGYLVSELKTKQGPTQAMKQNPWNAVMHLGHNNGTVSLWTPTQNLPVVKMQSNRGPIRDLAVDREGRYMAVGGSDKRIQLWDLRKLQELDSYLCPTPPKSLDISDRGLLSVAWGPHVTVWKDIFKTHQEEPYLTHLLPSSRIEKVQHVPFEDVLGIGHAKGVSTMIVPGAGEANFDALEVNPYESTKQKQEKEVHSLLNKLAPDTVALDPTFIGMVDKNARNVRLNHRQLQDLEWQEKREREGVNLAPLPDLKPLQSKLKKYLQKHKTNVMDARRVRIERNLRMEEERRKRKAKDVDDVDELLPAFNRFK